MDKEKIKEAVKVYLQEENSDYAIMLNGKWGSGKTYFVKNELIDHIQEQDNRNVIYISLFGITTIDELYNNISLHLVNIKANEYAQNKRKLYDHRAEKKKINTSDAGNVSFLSTVISQSLNLLPEAGVIKSLTADINNKIIKFDRYIFIFDDLERSSLGYDTLLGFFDKIADQNKLKAILVCNEDKINEKDKDEFYKTFKEKVVGLTIEYNSNMASEFDNIINHYVEHEDIKKYFYDNKERILSLLKSADSCNLRTLIFACKRFSELYEKIKDIYIKHDTECKYAEYFFEEILLAVVGSSILIKEQHRSNDFKNEEKVLATVNDKIEDKRFYLKDEESYSAYKFVDEYLNKYYFEKCVLDDLLPEYINSRKIVEQDKIKEELISIYYMDNDNEVINRLNIILEKIKENKINVNIYSQILNEIFIFYPIFLGEEKLCELKEIIKQNALTRLSEFSIHSWSIFDCHNEEADLFKNELYNFIQEENEKIKLSYINELFDKDNEIFVEEFEKIMKNRSIPIRRDGIFISALDVEKIFEKIKSMNNKELDIFWKGLSHVYQESITNLKEFYFGDKKFFRELKEKIESELLTEKNSKSEIQKLRLKRFCRYLDTIYNKL